MLSIRTNTSSLAAQRNLSNTQSQLDTSLSKLSSGYRITKAADDAAGLGISTNLNAQIKSYDQAGRNANDGLSVVQTAEAALTEVSNILTRMRELAVQAKTGTYQASDMQLAVKEYDQLKSEIRRIAQVTSFNRLNVANGTASSNGTADAEITTFSFFVGARVQDRGNSISFSASTLDMNNIDGSTTGDFTSAYTGVMGSNAAGGLGTIAETTTKSGDTSGIYASAAGAVATGPDNAALAIQQIDKALDLLASKRATAGALVNRLEHTVSNLLNVNQRLTEAESRIRDADYAGESANLARGMVLAQAGTAMLAQANQQPQYILQLLK